MSIGRVLNTAFGAIFGNLFVMLGIAFLFAGLPRGIVTFFQQSAQAQIGSGIVTPAQFLIISMAGLGVTLVFAIFAQGALTRATVMASDGETARLGDVLGTAARRFLPMVGLAIVSGLAFLAATLLLIVPGIILATVWYLAAPLVVAEREGVFASLARSADLTRGDRWNIFLVMLITVGFLLVVFMLTTVLTGMGIAIGLRSGGLSSIALPMAIISSISTTLQVLLTAAIPTAVYVELRQLKEGPEAQGLVEVFA